MYKKLKFTTFLATLFLLKFFTIACSQNAAKMINVKTYGAKGDGKTDDTKSLRSAFKAASLSGVTVYFPAGIYLTDIIDIRPPENSIIAVQGEKNKVTIKKNITDKTNVALFFCEIKNVKISFRGLTLDGSASARKGKWHNADRNGVVLDDEINGIYCYNVASLQVNNCRIQNFHGKGIAAFNTDQLIVQNNIIREVNNSAIQGHRVNIMKALNNVINHTGYLNANDLVNGRPFNSSNIPATLFGDGIEAECNELQAIGNNITNPGRCGIVHDLAKDLVVSNNIISVNGKIANNNPPAGMWFEQSANLSVTHNQVYLKKTLSKFVSGIRFYAVTNRIDCSNNIIEAVNYNHISDAGIGIYEPATNNVKLSKNSVKGNFSNSISVSYEFASSYISNLNISDNSLLSATKGKSRIALYVGNQQHFPRRGLITKNNFGSVNTNPIIFNHYGQPSSATSDQSKVTIQSNIINGKNSNVLPDKVNGVVFTNQ
jgi:hypothetical protein